THSAERNEKRVFAANAISHPTEDERPQWTDQEAGGEQRNRAQQSRYRMGLFEELDRQDRRQASENVEVIPLDDISHCRRDDHTSEVLGNLRPGHILVLPTPEFSPGDVRGGAVCAPDAGSPVNSITSSRAEAGGLLSCLRIISGRRLPRHRPARSEQAA